MSNWFMRPRENSTYEDFRVGRIIFACVVGFLIVVMLGAALINPPFKKVDRGEIGLSYGGGPFEGRHFQGIKEGGGSLFFNGFADPLFTYPTTQRNYIISQREGEGDVGRPDSVQAVTSDNVQVHFEVAVYFKLNTNDNRLREFHEDIGLKYHAWEGDGWDKMLNDSFRQQIENAIQEETRSVDIESLYSNQDELLKVQSTVGAVLRDRVASSLGGDYFCGPTFVRGKEACPEFEFIIKRVTVPEDVKLAFEANRTSLIKVQTKQNEIAQRTAEAAAIRELNAALNEAGDQYVLLKAIEAGTIKFWVLPSGTPVTVPTP